MDVVGVPVQVGDRAVVLAGVQHDDIQERSELEAPPDAQVVVHLDLTVISECHSTTPAAEVGDLPDGHPLEVRADRVHLALVDRDAAIVQEGLFSVVQSGRAIAIGVVADLCSLSGQCTHVVYYT